MAGEEASTKFDLVRQSLEQSITTSLVIGIVVVTLTAMGWLAYSRAVSLIVLQ